MPTHFQAENYGLRGSQESLGAWGSPDLLTAAQSHLLQRSTERSRPPGVNPDPPPLYPFDPGQVLDLGISLLT